MIYLTYGDVDSPIFKTQVIDFCDFVERELGIPVVTVSFVPLTLIGKQKKKLSRYNRPVHVLPVINRWQGKPWYSWFNALLLRRFKAHSIMTRNPSGFHVCRSFQTNGHLFFYDARGCHYKELEEFSSASKGLIDEVMENEIQCFKNADWVFSVSKALVDHFKFEHRYNDHNHSIIPCCTQDNAPISALSKTDLFGTEDVRVFCYAGALSVWNYPKSFRELCKAILKDPLNRIIILSHELENLSNDPLYRDEKVFMKAVKSEEVSSYLAMSDYGILLRKKAVTNKVASPSKFAEYLMSGCQVIISPDLGDFSHLVQSKGLGMVYAGRKDDSHLGALKMISSAERQRIRLIAKDEFMRSSEWNKVKYRNLKKLHNGF